MNKMNRIYYFTTLLLAMAAMAGCKKSFLEKPPLSSIVDANFYKTDEQVLASTAFL